MRKTGCRRIRTDPLSDGLCISCIRSGNGTKNTAKYFITATVLQKEFFVTSPTSDETESVRIYDEEGRFIGIYRYDKRQENYKPVKIFLEQ